MVLFLFELQFVRQVCHYKLQQNYPAVKKLPFIRIKLFSWLLLRVYANFFPLFFVFPLVQP